MIQDELDAVERAVSLLANGGFAGMTDRVVNTFDEVVDAGISELVLNQILLRAEPKEIPQLWEVATRFRKGTAKLLVELARIYDRLNEVRPCAALLSQALTLLSPSGPPDASVVRLLFGSSHRLTLLGFLNADFWNQRGQLLQQLTTIATLLDTLERALAATPANLSLARTVTASLTWLAESTPPEHLELALEGVTVGIVLVKRWHSRTRKRLLPEDKREYYQILYALSEARVRHPKVTLAYFNELNDQYLQLTHVPSLISSEDERRETLNQLLAEARQCAISLPAEELRRSRNPGLDIWLPLADISLAIASEDATAISRIKLLNDSVQSYEEVLTCLPQNQKTLFARIYRSLGACHQMLGALSSSGANQTNTNHLDLAEAWLVRSAAELEPGLDIRVEKVQVVRNIGVHLQLASIYANRGDRAAAGVQIAFELCDATPDPAERDRLIDLLGASGWFSRFCQRPWHEAVAEILEDAASCTPSLRTLRALLGLYRRKLGGPRKNLRLGSLAERLLQLGQQQECPEVLGLSPHLHATLKDYRQMEAYINSCRKSLDSGSSVSLLKDFPVLLEADRFLSYDGKTPDDLLLTFQASALLAIGNIDRAKQILTSALEADDSPRNQGEVWQLRGEVFMAEGNPLEAARAFERAYVRGGMESFGPLLRAAKAYSSCGLHDRAVLLMYSIIGSDRDSSELKSRTQLAKCLWARYSSRTEGVWRNDDVHQACCAIEPILSGAAGYPGDLVAADALANMAPHPHARAVILKLLRHGHPAAREGILRRLSSSGQFHPELVPVVLTLVNDFERLDHGTELFTNFLMGAWVDAYFKLDRDAFANYVTFTVTSLLPRVATDSFWSLVLACNKGAMIQRLEGTIQKKARDAVETLLGEFESATVETVRREVASDLYDRLDTHLLDTTPMAYGGREPGTSLRDRLVSIRELAETCGTDSVVPEFHALWATTFILRVRDALTACDFPLKDSFDSPVLSLHHSNTTEELRLTFPLSVLVRDFNLSDARIHVESLALFERWRNATLSFAPCAINVAIDSDTPSLVVSVSLPGSRVEEDSDWEWLAFYNHVVRDSFDKFDLGSSYYATAFRLIPSVLSFNSETITRYILSQMDGLFSHVYRAKQYQLASVSHTVQKIVNNLSFSDGPDKQELFWLLQELRREILTVRSYEPDSDLDLGVVLVDVSRDCGRLDPSVTTDLSLLPSNDLAVIYGNSTMIRRALLDILANAFVGMAGLNASEKGILFRLTREADTITISILNTGTSAPTSPGFGIGAKTVDYVMDHHVGVARSGPVADAAPYNYQWVLEFPLSQNRRGRS